jgi:hypothetical protein
MQHLWGMFEIFVRQNTNDVDDWIELDWWDGFKDVINLESEREYEK